MQFCLNDSLNRHAWTWFIFVKSKTRKTRKFFSKIFKSEFSILAIGQNRKLGNKKTRNNISEISKFSVCYFFIFFSYFFLLFFINVFSGSFFTFVTSVLHFINIVRLSLIDEIWFHVFMFWSIKYIHNREYKCQNKKTAKLWILSIFLTKEGLNKYIKFLCEMKQWSKLRRCCVKKVFLGISQNLPENTCVGVSFLIKLQLSDLKPC